MSFYTSTYDLDKQQYKICQVILTLCLVFFLVNPTYTYSWCCTLPHVSGKHRLCLFFDTASSYEARETHRYLKNRLGIVRARGRGLLDHPCHPPSVPSMEDHLVGHLTNYCHQMSSCGLYIRFLYCYIEYHMSLVSVLRGVEARVLSLLIICELPYSLLITCHYTYWLAWLQYSTCLTRNYFYRLLFFETLSLSVNMGLEWRLHIQGL